MRKQNGAVCLGKRDVEAVILLNFVFKNVVIVDCVAMSQAGSHVTAMNVRVTSEAPEFLITFSRETLLHAVFVTCLFVLINTIVWRGHSKRLLYKFRMTTARTPLMFVCPICHIMNEISPPVHCYCRVEV